MTKQQFKDEVLADLEYQLTHKGKEPRTSEHWYLSRYWYPLAERTKKQVIRELVAEGKINRLTGPQPFVVLELI
jgi:hypothetical protein